MVNIESTQPMELICVDFLKLEPSGGIENILVVTDHFTKYVQAFPACNQTAKQLQNSCLKISLYIMDFQLESKGTKEETLKVL